jgi:hypothetical protein
MSITNQRESRKVDKGRAYNFVHPHPQIERLTHDEGRPTPQDAPIDFFLLSSLHTLE